MLVLPESSALRVNETERTPGNVSSVDCIR